MTRPIRKIVYFNKWVAPVATEILSQRSDIRLQRLLYTDSEVDISTGFIDAHGYQSLPKAESVDRWAPCTELIRQSPNLLAVCSAGAGYDVVDVDACTAAGIIVCNQSGTNQEAVAEHALGLMLALSKRIAYWDREMRRRPNINRFDNMGNSIYGKILGTVGFGPIGARLAELCRVAFGMRVLVFDPYQSSEKIAQKGGEKVELDELLQQADFVSLHCPLTKETRGMFGAKEFGMMKSSAYFITTARGHVHSEEALLDALRSGRIAGAGLDVFHDEPPPIDHPLLRLDNVVATPHMGGITVEALHETAEHAANQWITIFNGAVPPRLVNPQAWPLYSERFMKLLGIRPDALT